MKGDEDMDEFLRQINIQIFRQWIMNQSKENFEIYQTSDPDVIAIETISSYTEISFNDMDIIEFVVNNKHNQRVEFYIHFQMNTLSHAVGLYKEMLECIHNTMTSNGVKILLCCSGGLTTGMYIDDLNKAAELLGLDYDFSAIPYANLYEVGSNYDVILLAPQISYEYSKIIQVLKDVLVIKIPPKVFAKYNVTDMLSLIDKEMRSFKKRDESKTQEVNFQLPHIQQEILCISVKRVRAPRININYKLFRKGKVIVENEIIKTRSITEKDIYDVIEVMFAKHPNIKIVGISMLGIVNDHGVHLPGHFLDGFDFMTPLREKYPATFILENDINCAALGFYLVQQKYHSISMVTKTRLDKPGGVGSVVNGNLLTGLNHLAGEIQYLPIDLDEYIQDYQGYVEVLAHYLLSIIALLSPQVIAIYSPVISQTEELIYYITQKLPRKFIPELILIDDLSEYASIGLLQQCINTLEK